jgi:hypothetical protein
MFFRESSTRFYTDFRLAQNLLPVVNDDVPSKNLYPTELTFNIGFGF